MAEIEISQIFKDTKKASFNFLSALLLFSLVIFITSNCEEPTRSVWYYATWPSIYYLAATLLFGTFFPFLLCIILSGYATAIVVKRKLWRRKN